VTGEWETVFDDAVVTTAIFGCLLHALRLVAFATRIRATLSLLARACAARVIAHRLTQPFRPQTNSLPPRRRGGMVERCNRRLGEHLARMPQNRAAHHRRFLDHAERDAYLHTFVADYNRTRLRCLDYQAPAELLAKLAGHNMTRVRLGRARCLAVFTLIGSAAP
jgi:hypothetical protein